MKKTAIIAVVLLLGMAARAQVSGIEYLQLLYNYDSDTSIVRNYNDTISVVMIYGHDANAISTNGLINSSSFILRDNTNRSFSHIVTLPVGYRVNDVRFVSLTRISGEEDWYCCFCGTRYEYRDMYAMVDSNGTPTNTYFYVYDSVGFVGFFKMEEALSPSNTFTAKLRDVEWASQLFRMTCYAEFEGRYYQDQYDYKDNAVLDVIGVPISTTGTCSAFWRVKFYPVVPTSFQPTGTRWDNNIRYDTTGIEKMEDVIQTDSHVVTVSRKIDSDNQLWLRFSGKETVQVLGGMELNPYYHPLDFYLLTIADEQVLGHQYAVVETPRLCSVFDEEFAVSFRMLNPEAEREGLLTFRHDLSNRTYATMEGLFDEGDYGLDDIVYVPEYDATATLQHHYGGRAHTTDLNYWSSAIGVYHMMHRLQAEEINLQSLCRYNLGGDQLLWSGIDAETGMHQYILYQRTPNPGEVIKSCQKHEVTYSLHSKIDMGTGYRKFFIQNRFDDIWQDYDVKFIHFDPYTIRKDDVCKEW